MPYLFNPPTVQEGPSGGNHRLFDFYTISRGITVIKLNGQYRQIRFPSQDLLESVDAYYLGGHIHTIDDTTAAELTVAGYEDYLTEIV
jgi:hypothetical protein